jgi:hypothetical protein
MIDGPDLTEFLVSNGQYVELECLCDQWRQGAASDLPGQNAPKVTDTAKQVLESAVDTAKEASSKI